MNNVRKILFSITFSILFLFQNVTFAALPKIEKKIYQVTKKSEFHNENWFPLSKKDMKEAAIDTAFDSLTQSGWFQFDELQKNNNPLTGLLTAKVTLVEPAEIVKITLKLSLSDDASYIATASTSVRGLEFQGIYYAFENIGRLAAERMNAKLTALEMLRVVKLSRTIKTTPSLNSAETELAKSLYIKAQDLKEQYNFRDSAVLFEQLIAIENNHANEWINLGIDELKYGLPYFEANYWRIKAGSMMANLHYEKVEKYWKKAEQAYRTIVAENIDNVERVTTARREIDNLNLSRRQLVIAYQYDVRNNLNIFKIEIQNKIMMGRKFPNKKQLKKMLQKLNYTIVIDEYNEQNLKHKIILRETRSNKKFILNADKFLIQILPM